MSLNQFLAMSAAPQQGGQAASNSGAMMMNFVFIGLMIVIFYMLIWRPNAQRQKKHREMLANLQKGDRIVTNGGLHATVLNVKDDLVVCTIAEGIKVEIARSAVAGVLPK